MKRLNSDIGFTPAVKVVQERRGTRERALDRIRRKGDWKNFVTSELAEFIAQRDSFYLGTATKDGQPYIQFRGGPKGFLKVVDERTLGFADFRGNRQYITEGNLTENDKAHMFLMDYPNQVRIKIWGRAEVVEDAPELLEKLMVSGYKAIPERVILFRIEAWDVNCQSHIPKKFTEEEWRKRETASS